MENKKSGTFKPVTRQMGMRTIKRKVPYDPSDTVIKTEVISNEDSSEQSYTVMESEHVEQGYENDENTVYISDPLQLVSHEGEIHYHYENQEESGGAGGQENSAAAWSENSSLADVVKSILGPNQEGPVILHVNNYDGVAVVQVADPQNYSASEAHESESVPENDEVATSTVETPVEQSTPRLIVKKTQIPKKPVVVTALPADSKKGTSPGNLLKSAQLKKQSVPSTSQKALYEDKFLEDGNNDSSQDDLSDSQSDNRSVLDDERTMYRVKTKKIKLQIDTIKNCIERQELEKRKLQLEVKLLKMQVDEKEKESQTRTHHMVLKKK